MNWRLFMDHNPTMFSQQPAWFFSAEKKLFGPEKKPSSLPLTTLSKVFTPSEIAPPCPALPLISETVVFISYRTKSFTFAAQKSSNKYVNKYFLEIDIWSIGFAHNDINAVTQSKFFIKSVLSIDKTDLCQKTRCQPPFETRHRGSLQLHLQLICQTLLIIIAAFFEIFREKLFCGNCRYFWIQVFFGSKMWDQLQINAYQKFRLRQCENFIFVLVLLSFCAEQMILFGSSLIKPSMILKGRSSLLMELLQGCVGGFSLIF